MSFSQRLLFNVLYAAVLTWLFKNAYDDNWQEVYDTVKSIGGVPDL